MCVFVCVSKSFALSFALTSWMIDNKKHLDCLWAMSCILENHLLAGTALRIAETYFSRDKKQQTRYCLQIHGVNTDQKMTPFQIALGQQSHSS